MAVNYTAVENLLPVAGIKLSAVEANIRYKNRHDMVLVSLAKGSVVSGMFTQNAFCAAPVIIAKRHINTAQAWLINAGNANAGTGETGLLNALATCEIASTELSLELNEVMPFSTGVIGEQLDVSKFADAMATAVENLSADNWLAAATAIMTTDTVAKGASRQVEIDGITLTITGIAKGAGMIRPDMATMLGFIGTDAKIAKPDLDTMLREAVAESFNAVTIDGDTSTNDACVIAATGQSGVVITEKNASIFQAALNEICIELAQALIRDGEGATKFVGIHVTDASSKQEARDVAYTVAHSPLVKTALFASDANWGRILAAVGRAPVTGLNVDLIDIALNDVTIVTAGGVDKNYTEQQGAAVMQQAEIDIYISLGRGNAKTTVWTSDLSHDYVSINADYRS